MTATRLRKGHEIDWRLSPEVTDNGARVIVLSAETDWTDPIVRADVRSDARVLHWTLRRPIQISSPAGVLETIGRVK